MLLANAVDWRGEQTLAHPSLRRNLFLLLLLLSCVQLFATPWTVARQAPLSIGFPQREYWSGLPFPSPGELPDPEIEPVSLALACGFFTTSPGKPKKTVPAFKGGSGNDHRWGPAPQAWILEVRSGWEVGLGGMGGGALGQLSRVDGPIPLPCCLLAWEKC